MTVNQRIKFLREREKLTQQVFADAIGVSRANLSQIEIEKQLPTLPQLERIAETYNVSFDWLMNARKNIAHSSIVAEDIDAYNTVGRKKDVDGRKGIPLIPTDAFAGTGGGDVSISEHDINEYYIVPDFGQVDYMIKVKGDSMMPTYRNGDIVALRIVIDRGFTQWHRVYVVATSQGVVIKRLHEGNKPDVLIAHSDNSDYPPFEIPTDNITNLALVVGVIRPE